MTTKHIVCGKEMKESHKEEKKYQTTVKKKASSTLIYTSYTQIANYLLTLPFISTISLTKPKKKKKNAQTVCKCMYVRRIAVVPGHKIFNSLFRFGFANCESI